MARTMTDEQEREIRVYCEAANPAYIGKKLRAELDAERAAHEETKAKLALAEAAILDHFGDTPHGFYECEHGAKATEPCDEAGESCSLHNVRTILAWRAGK